MNYYRIVLIALSIIYSGNWEKIMRALRHKEFPDYEFCLSLVKSIKSQVLTIFDPEYPTYLKEMFMPPFVLYYYGDISLLKDLNKNLGVVGTRHPTSHGIEATRNIVTPIAKEYVIVSGLAIGVDGLAHQIAVENEGKTIAVLGCGIDVCYPPSNKDLYDAIKENHLLLSEYPNDTPPTEDLFPLRNRIISQLSKGLLVTESKIRSGTSITINYSLTMNKDVMCVPSSDLENSGCNKFIKEGAHLVENAEDVAYIMQ